MATINLKRFVDINIQYHEKSSVAANRPTTVLIASEGAGVTEKTYVSYKVDDNGNYTFGYYASSSATTLTYESLSSYPSIEANAKVYFTNKGNKLKVLFKRLVANVNNIIAGLADEEIVVTGCGDFNYSVMKAAAQTRAADSTVYGINQKIILAKHIQVVSDSIKNFGLKFSATTAAEMAMAAYLSNINFDGANTVLDYMYTKENVPASILSDADIGEILDANMNVNVKLANANINLGGNLTDGTDLVNQFALIVLHQTLTSAIFNLLLTKIKGTAGLGAIQSVVANEMQRYLKNGYLSTDKVWTDETLTVSYNNQTFKIIEKNTPLLQGYQFVTLPLSALSDTDRDERKTPPMYLIIAESYGIRVVTINGEVI